MEEEEKKEPAAKLDFNQWRKHLESQCDGKDLKCEACHLNIYQMYHRPKMIDDFYGHNCVRDLRRKLKDALNDLQLQRQSNVRLIKKNADLTTQLEAKIKQEAASA